jgi:hypothetical protein
MKIIQTLSLAAIVAAFTATASAFPYTNPHYGPPPTREVVVVTRAPAPGGPTVAVFVQGRGVGSIGMNNPAYRPNWSGKITLHGWE